MTTITSAHMRDILFLFVPFLRLSWYISLAPTGFVTPTGGYTVGSSLPSPATAHAPGVHPETFSTNISEIASKFLHERHTCATCKSRRLQLWRNSIPGDGHPTRGSRSLGVHSTRSSSNKEFIQQEVHPTRGSRGLRYPMGTFSRAL